MQEVLFQGDFKYISRAFQVPQGFACALLHVGAGLCQIGCILLTVAWQLILRAQKPWGHLCLDQTLWIHPI